MQLISKTFSPCKTETIPTKQLCFLLPTTPGDHHSTFYFYEFEMSDFLKYNPDYIYLSTHLYYCIRWPYSIFKLFITKGTSENIGPQFVPSCP